MALGALVVAILALAVGTVSLIISAWQAKASVHDLELQRRAHITARRGGTDPLDDGGHVVRVLVRNVGRSPARHVFLSLVNENDEMLVYSFEELALWPGDPEIEHSFIVPSSMRPRELHVQALWKDEESGNQPRFRRILTLRG